MFKICAIGCGFMAVDGHGPAFKKYSDEYNDVCLAGCCDVDEEKAKAYKEKFGFEKYYTDYKAMLDEIKPDVVSLMCPVKFTKDISIDVIKKGYNIILEKPPGLNTDELNEMIKVAKESNVFIRTAFNRRYSPIFLKLKEKLKGKRIFNITYQMYRHSRFDEDFATTAIHAIDATKNIVGSDYKKIDFKYQELSDLGKNIANYYLNCEFENGVIGQLTIVTMGGAIAERVTVNTQDELFIAELPFWNNFDAPGRLRVLIKNELVEDIKGDELTDTTAMFEECGFYEENRSFFELIRSGAEPTCDLETGIQSVDIANYLRQRESTYEK